MYRIILDTETTNDIECPLVYDLGFAVIDNDCNIIETFSFVVADIFLNKELMSFAFFANKIPSYWEDIKAGRRELRTFYNIERVFRSVCDKYNINEFVAHNIKFDYTSLQTTKRYLTKSKYRFFFPYGAKFVDTLKLSRNAFATDEYTNFCKDNEYITKNGQNRYTAEILYRYLTNCNDFEEEHTGLADVLIENEILRYCLETLLASDGYLW